MARRIGITGATGFIGKELVNRHLAQGDQIRVLTRQSLLKTWQSNSVQCFQGDLSSNDSLLEFVDGLDVLYNCAGEVRDESKMEALHIKGVHRLAEASIGRIRHWVQLSSVGVYGSVSEGLISEDSSINPVGLYEITKAKSDQIVIDVSSKGGFSHSILRPSNVYGARMPNQSLFNMISLIDKRLFLYIGKIGASANYIHVDNVVEGLMICGYHPLAKGRIYNLSDYRTLENFVDLISIALNCSSPLFRLPYSVAYVVANTLGKLPSFPLTQSRLDALVNRSIYPITLIQNELGYQHVISMEDGSRELVEAYKQQVVAMDS